MNSKTFIVIASPAASAFAQLASIVSPTNGSTITAGSQLIVDVHQDEAATDDVVQIAIVLGLEPCLSTPCTDIVPGQNGVGVGTILLKSLFDPQRDPSLPPQEGMHQNFSMVVPENVLSLTHAPADGRGEQERGSGDHRDYRHRSVMVS